MVASTLNTSFGASMETAHSPGFASRLWKKLRPVDIQDRIGEISKQFTGARWKNLPQELVDEILGYLLDDLRTLKACSLTCRCLFGAVRPLIHQRLVCLGSTSEWHRQVKRSLLSRRKRDPGAFEQLIGADRLGVLRYTRSLTLKSKHVYHSLRFSPGNMREYLPHLRSISKLQSLTLETFYLSPFIPVFHEYFGSFTNTLQRLDIRDTGCAVPELLYIICQFPLLEDLAIVFPAIALTAHPEHQVPTITRSPPLRGKLAIARVHSRELSEGLAALPGGLNFRSLELTLCGRLETVFNACSHTVTSVSYLWRWGDIGLIPLDLKRNVVLESFEFNISLNSVSLVHEWVYQTLRTITSPAFNEFVIWILDSGFSQAQMNRDGWAAVDALLKSMVERNPNFMVVFRGGFHSFRDNALGDSDGARSFVAIYFPLVLSSRRVKFECVPRVGNRFERLGIL